MLNKSILTHQIKMEETEHRLFHFFLLNNTSTPNPFTAQMATFVPGS